MSTATDREIIAARAARHDEEFEHLIGQAMSVMTSDPVAGIVRALFAAAETFSAEAADLEARKKKGYVTTCREWRDAAMKLRGLATQVENYGARNVNRNWWPLGAELLSPDQQAAVTSLTEHIAATTASLPSGTMTVDGLLVPIGVPVPVAPSEPAAQGHYAPGLPDGYGLPADTLAGYLAGTTDVDPITAPNAIVAVNGVPVPNPVPVGTIAPGDTITITTNPFRAPVTAEPVGDPWAKDDEQPPTPQPVVVPVDVANPFTSPKAPGRMVARPSFLDVVTLAGQLSSNPSSSYSQIRSVRTCGMQYTLGRLSRRGLVGPERPGWGSVGGTALHAAIEAYEDWFPANPELDDQGLSPNLDEIWTNAFATTVEAKRADAGPYQDLDSWHASNRRKEGYDWWRVEGREMLDRYVRSHGNGWADRLSLVAQEWEYRLPITDTMESHGYVDQIWSDAVDPAAEGRFIIDDLKSGARLPKDVIQLAEYAWALVKVRGIDPARVEEVAYWNARTGERTAYANIFERVTWDDLVYYHVATANAKNSPTPIANLTDLCGGCSVKDLCPAQKG